MKQSAGILLYKTNNRDLQVFLVHPGGPFWKNKDLGSWSISKGEFNDKAPLDAAIREFEEETGKLLTGPFAELTPLKLKSGKLIYAWALEGEIDPDSIISNTFEVEWPPKSAKRQKFPEVDRAQWFTADEARVKINIAQVAFIDQLVGFVNNRIPNGAKC